MSSPDTSGGLPTYPGVTQIDPTTVTADDHLDDPLAEWRRFWRRVGHGVPRHVNRARRLRFAIRRLGLR